MSAISTLFWFRKGLRLHDNPALAAAVEGTSKLYPVFCLDPWFVSSGRVGANRLHFLLQSLQDLDQSLRKHDSRLIVLRGNPSVELQRAMREWKIERLAYEIDTEPYAKTRDAEISGHAAEQGIDVVTRWGHTLCDLDALLKRHPGGKPTTTYGSFLTHLDKQIKAGDVVVVRYEGPVGGPGMREMLAPTSAIVGQGLGDKVALITDGRFSGATQASAPI